MLTKLLAFFVVLSLPAHAARVVLDAEFSHYAEQLVKPLLPNLPHTEGVSFVLVADDTLNAFVTGERVVYIHAGLFLNAQGSNDIQGVLAHELGHLSSQHLHKMHDNIRASTFSLLAGALVGVGAVAVGAPQVAAAAMITGQAGGIAQMLQYSRTHEREADQRAITALHGAGYSAQGMVNTFEKLRVESQLAYGSIPPYLVTHPLPHERMASLARAVQVEGDNIKPHQANDPAFQRMEAKVYALTHTPAATLRRYPDATLPHRYARALAHTARGKLDDAEREATHLLKAAPNDVFYQELAAQIAVHRGKLKPAAEGFARILGQNPNLLLVRFQLADVQRALGQTDAALANYRTITQNWPVWAEPWRGMGLCYGKQGKFAHSHMALAQAAYYSANPTEAKAQLAIARTHLAKTPAPELDGWLASLARALGEKPTPSDG